MKAETQQAVYSEGTAVDLQRQIDILPQRGTASNVHQAIATPGRDTVLFQLWETVDSWPPGRASLGLNERSSPAKGQSKLPYCSTAGFPGRFMIARG